MVFINKVTTNLSYFFREKHHFQYLQSTVLPDIEQRNRATRKLRIWSAACSSGQEAYSVAMTLAEEQNFSDWDTRILATDINTSMVEQCSQGIYDEEQLRGLQPSHIKQWFEQTDADEWKISSELQRLLLVNRLNLFNEWPFTTKIDIIFCRNVLIYFELEKQAEILNRFADVQSSGAYLFLGHAESLVSDIPYKRINNTIYQRC